MFLVFPASVWELRLEVYVSHINIIWNFSNNSKTEDDINWFIIRNLA